MRNRKPVRRRANILLDIDDENLRRAVDEMLKAEDLDPVDFEAEIHHQSGIQVSPIGKAYEPEFVVVESYDEAVQAAQEYVSEMLYEEPELFNQSWLMHYIDEDSLRDALHSDLYDSAYEDISYEADLHPEDVAEELDIDVEDFGDADGDVDEEALRAEIENHLDDYADSSATSQLSDPIQYLQDMLGDEEGIKMAMKWGGLDYARATSDAVDEDGPGHFLSSYDGNLEELPSGGVYWRTN